MRAQAALKRSRARISVSFLCAALLALGLAPAAAQAERALLSTHAVEAEKVPGGQIEGACGVAAGGERIYVSDYYRHRVDVFSSSGAYLSQIAGNPADGPCQLALASTGALYANDWHEGVERLLPSHLGFDQAESTGVAVDQASGKVYVDDRSYVAVYEPSGGPPTLQIGLGSLEDGYGVAVAAGRVYVPDAADNTVKVYEPAVDALDPVAVIGGAATPAGRFVSLLDAAVAVDPTNGHLLVLDNLQPGFEHPEAAIEEFDAAGSFVGQVAQRVIDGEPSGLAFGAGGGLYVTSGNSEGSSVYQLAPYTTAASAALKADPPPDLAGAFPQSAAGPLATAPGQSSPPGPGEPTRDTYTAAVEPICRANTQASQRILKGVRQEVRAGRLKPAAAQFAKASAALGRALAQLRAVPEPAADRARLAKWLAYLKAEVELFAATAKKLKAGVKAGAEAVVLRLTHNAERANLQVLPFEFRHCRFDPPRFS
jgi:hypothetical protein